jgi:phosphatidylserine/phosphatidylglycerophosphate/cardiolipin synthase-like enzyme
MSGVPVPPDRVVVSLEERRAVLLDVIGAARSNITLSLFRGNDQQVFDALTAATERGVAVDVLITSRAKGGRRKIERLWRALEATGATLRAYTDPVVKYHAKYLVVDDGPAIVTSLNLTRKCFSKTMDALVVTYDSAVVASLRRLWSADCDDQPCPDGLSPRLIVGPERARRRLTALVARARTSIRVIDAKISDPAFLSLLQAQRADGLTVEVFSAKQIGELKSHGKIMLVDDKTAVVGSVALATPSLDFRREVALVVTESAAVADVRSLFDTVREATLGEGSVLDALAPK